MNSIILSFSLIQNLNYNSMNISHKCHFHPANLIAKFCSNQQCTLPLCYQCEPIHFQQHASRQSQPKLLRFNQAYFQAINRIEEFLDKERQYFKETENKLKEDKQTVIQWIDNYYGQIHNALNTNKDQSKQIEQKLIKLKKGSIKTLIFFYSGEILFPKYKLQFEMLSDKIQTLNNPKTQIVKTQIKKSQKLPLTQEKSHNFENRRYIPNYDRQITQEQIKSNKMVKEISRTAVESENIFTNIEDIKKQKYRQKNIRKSIFDQYDKISKVPNESNGANLTAQALHQQVPSETKYNYTRQTEIEIQKDSENVIEPSPKFNHQNNKRALFVREKPIFIQEQQPISFQKRYTDKPFEPQRQYDQFKIQKNEQQPKQLTIQNHYRQTRNQIQKQNNVKLMKPSDLEIDGQISKKYTLTNTSSSNNLVNQRNRAFSQTNLTDRESRKNAYEYDMKKQVLAPAQIRKMLQKRIEERHQILSIKKSDNNQQAPYDQKIPIRKAWETKDSIINQIYGQPKY